MKTSPARLRTTRWRRIASATAVAAALTAVAPAPVAGAQSGPAARDARTAAPAPAAQTVTARSLELYPEGVAWDPSRQAFLVTSSRHGSVSVVRLDGSVEELTPSIGMVSTLGIKVDRARGRILVAYSDYWVRRMSPVEQPPTSGVAVISLATGKLLKKIDTAQGRENTFANDLAFDPVTGRVYVTDSVSDTLQQIDLRGRVTDLVTDDRFTDDKIGLNGIAWHPRGHILVSRHDSGAVFRVSVRGTPRVHQVDVPLSLAGADGMALRSDGTLLVVQNTLGRFNGMPGGVDAVTALASDDNWRTARPVARTEPWPVAGPTTVAVGSRGAYVVSGQMEALMTGSSVAEEFWLRRVPF